MALSILVFVQVSLWFCVVTTSMGGITDWQKEFSQLENKVKDSQEEMTQIIQHLEKRLQILEAKGEFGEIQICTCSPYVSCLSVRTISPIENKLYKLP